jgi:hypothetical protein
MLGIKADRSDRREERLSRIRELGYEVQDRSGIHNGQFASRRYFLVGPNGIVLDNDGSGYASSSEAFRAALADSEKRN